MKKSIRLALITGACFLGLAFAAPAFSAYNPSLIMEQSSYKVGGATTADVFIAIDPDADPTAKLTIFSPIGYTANLTAAPGTKIGTVVARVKAKAIAGALLTLAGDVLVANPADPAIQAAATKCTGKTTHSTIWVLSTSLQGQQVTIPVFVDQVGPLVTQQVCLPSPDVPPEMGGAVLGAQLFAADFTIKNVFTNAGATGGYEWSGIFTPYTPGTSTPNPSGTLEARTYVGLPSSLTLKRATAKRGFKLVGQLKIAGVNPQRDQARPLLGQEGRPGAERRLRGDRQAHHAQPEAPGQRQVLDRPAEREVRDLLPDEVRELHDGVHRALALRPAGSVSRRAHRRDHEQPAQGPEAEAQEEAPVVRSPERGLPPGGPAQRSAGRSSWRDHSCHEPG